MADPVRPVSPAPASRNARLYVLSASFGKQQPGSWRFLTWYSTHSQQIPFREQGSLVQVRLARFFSFLQSMTGDASRKPRLACGVRARDHEWFFPHRVAPPRGRGASHSPVERVLDLRIEQAPTMLVEFRDSEIAGLGKRKNGLASASRPKTGPENCAKTSKKDLISDLFFVINSGNRIQSRNFESRG